MNDRQCRHYGLGKREFFRLCCGHCMLFMRRKKLLPDTKACEDFSPGPADEDAFVTKQYLSKELLQYMMRLELLPKIKDADTLPKEPQGK